MKKIAVFASGRGSNFVKIYENIINGKIPAQVSCLITDKSTAGAIEFAEKNNIPFHVIAPKDYDSPNGFGTEILKVLGNYDIEWIVLAGYLKKVPDNVVVSFSNRIINIHPALLPAFGGKGMYGHFVHEAVYKSGAKISGVTIHLVNEVYDSGPVVMQKCVDIEKCSGPEEIAQAVLNVEHDLYSEAILRLLTIPFKVISNRVVFSA